ncbi:MAG: SGNH/GDSL hydrolase family protein, partial [Planctomycetes bacterium]|nr:SGNH/GDSL hydrolase family protein [Planctomycetota bacterium]
MIVSVARLVLALLLFVGTLRAQESPTVQVPRLQKGDRICLIGNALAERMQHHGWLEAYLQAHLPEHELSFRNLGFGADTLTVRQRTAGFGSPDDYLKRCKADVIFAFFGYNESFAGADGLDEFKKQLEEFIRHTLSQKYNGKSAPRLVIFSPIAHENLGNPNLPDGRADNERIALYTRAMAEVTAANEV